MTAKDIRLMRQLVQEVGRNPEIALEGAQAAQINKALGKAMDTYKPGYSDALDMYKTAQDALKDVPNVKAMEVGKLRAQIKQMESAFTNSKLSKTEAVKKAQLHTRQIKQKVNDMVNQGKLSDVYRKRLLYTLLGLSGAGTIAKLLP